MNVFWRGGLALPMHLLIVEATFQSKRFFFFLLFFFLKVYKYYRALSGIFLQLSLQLGWWTRGVGRGLFLSPVGIIL